jgi:hypothetical protein
MTAPAGAATSCVTAAYSYAPNPRHAPKDASPEQWPSAPRRGRKTAQQTAHRADDGHDLLQLLANLVVDARHQISSHIGRANFGVTRILARRSAASSKRARFFEGCRPAGRMGPSPSGGYPRDLGKSRSERRTVFWLTGCLPSSRSRWLTLFQITTVTLLSGSPSRIKVNQGCEGGLTLHRAPPQFLINRHTGHSPWFLASPPLGRKAKELDFLSETF